MNPIDVYYSPKGTPYVMASDLHAVLEIKTPLTRWFPRMIEYGFIENKDFSQMDKKVMLAQGGFNYWYIRIYFNSFFKKIEFQYVFKVEVTLSMVLLVEFIYRCCCCLCCCC